MEKRFHARWWDYSQKPMNLHGRIWIGNLLLFGLGGVIVVKIVNPILLPLFAKVAFRTRFIAAASLSAVFITDYIISHFVLKLVKDSVEKSEADNTEAIGREVRKMLGDKSLFARRFANAYPDVIYRTEKVKARMEAIKAETERLRKEVGSMLEPTGQIKNSIISKQDRLISRIYNPKSADDETRKLKDEIDKDMKRLKNRKVF